MEKLSSLAGNAQNPRRMREKNAEYLKNSIERFGDLSGTTYNVRTKRLVTGHQRKEVIERLIGEDPEIVWLEQYKKPTKQYTVAHGYMMVNGERFPVRFVDMDEATEAAANLTANSAFNQGEYDLELAPIVLDLADRSGLMGEMGLDLLLESLELDLDRGEKAKSQSQEEYDPTQIKSIKLVFTESEYLEIVDKLDMLVADTDDKDYSAVILSLVRNASN